MICYPPLKKNISAPITRSHEPWDNPGMFVCSDGLAPPTSSTTAHPGDTVPSKVTRVILHGYAPPAHQAQHAAATHAPRICYTGLYPGHTEQPASEDLAWWRTWSPGSSAGQGQNVVRHHALIICGNRPPEAGRNRADKQSPIAFSKNACDLQQAPARKLGRQRPGQT